MSCSYMNLLYKQNSLHFQAKTFSWLFWSDSAKPLRQYLPVSYEKLNQSVDATSGLFFFVIFYCFYFIFELLFHLFLSYCLSIGAMMFTLILHLLLANVFMNLIIHKIFTISLTYCCCYYLNYKYIYSYMIMSTFTLTYRITCNGVIYFTVDIAFISLTILIAIFWDH